MARSDADHPREITSRVPLVGPDGLLNPAAVGYARRPLVDTGGLLTRPHRSWGRTKRWEYWNVCTPTHIIALTVSSIDYAAVNEIWIFERSTGKTWGKALTVIPARGVTLPPSLDEGPTEATAKGVVIHVTPSGGEAGSFGARGVRIRAQCAGAEVDVTVRRPEGHECLAVVVPWSAKRFQYTIKDVALPASGTLTLEGVRHEIDGAWSVLDHGRGRWPYDVRWNWGAGSGLSGDTTIGLQVGGQWTDGTGQTENGVIVGGRLHKIHDELTWDFDRSRPEAPWHVHGGGLDATLTPFLVKKSRTNLGVLSGRTDQAFGLWTGTFAGDGVDIAFDELVGWAEDVHNRW